MSDADYVYVRLVGILTRQKIYEFRKLHFSLRPNCTGPRFP